MSKMVLLAFSLFLSIISPARGADFDHSTWDKLLKSHVIVVRNGLATQVDYVGMAADREILKQYLAQAAIVKRGDFDSWSRNEQLAFLINVYNASTVELVLTGYPKIKSIKDLGSLFQSPWKNSFISLLGKKRSLDDIEHGLIRGSGRYNDPRVHFAVNCASIGCPALRPEAFQAKLLESQLEDQTRKFLADSTRNRLEGDELNVSPIFKWYEEDFEKNWHNIRSLPDFFAHYSQALGLTAAQVQQLQSGEIEVEFLDYDWRLNAKNG